MSWIHIVIAWVKISCGVNYRVTGLENIQGNAKPFVVLSKHQSAWETLFLQGLFSPASTILKKELLTIPFFGWGLAALNPIAIDRANPRQALQQVKSEGVARITEGFNLVLFPEGTRTKPGERGKYARSGADIAIDAECDIIPIAVNAGHCWPSKSFVKFPGEIHVIIGKPISSSDKTSKVLIAEVENWIETQMLNLDKRD